MSVVYPFIHLHKHPEWNRVLLPALACLQLCNIKPTIHEATFVASDTATLLFVHAAHEINATFYKLFKNRQPVYFQAICRMYHAIFSMCSTREQQCCRVAGDKSCLVYGLLDDHEHASYRAKQLCNCPSGVSMQARNEAAIVQARDEGATVQASDEFTCSGPPN